METCDHSDQSDEEMDVIEESSDEMIEEEDEGEAQSSEDKKVYLPGQPLEEGEELVCDQTAYVMYHQAQTSAPCLSFDIIPDKLGDNRETFPMTTYLVSGTQAPQTHVNHLVVMRLSNLHKTVKGEDKEEESDDDDDDEDKHPKMHAAVIKHPGCVNRVRCNIFEEKVLAASWSELGKVYIWDLSEQLTVIENDQLLSKYNKEHRASKAKYLFEFKGHTMEGFAIDWSPTMSGVLATGDCKKDIHIYHPTENDWSVDQRPLVGHTGSVEDVQWSPNERNVLASCSVDKSIRVWDIRAPPNKACMLTTENAHEKDVNVINWNRNEPFIVSGGDDGFLNVWDLRKFQTNVPLAIFKHHTEPVVTVEWHPTDSAVFASGGADNQIALWDLSVEKDVESSKEEVEEVPPQLLFIHQGQNNIKELHWHPQLPGVIISTAESGFNIFRTISV